MSYELITVYELSEISGDELGRYQGTYGFFLDKDAAEKGAHTLQHPYYQIQPHKAIQLEDGKVFVLSSDKPVDFSFSRRAKWNT